MVHSNPKQSHCGEVAVEGFSCVLWRGPLFNCRRPPVVTILCRNQHVREEIHPLTIPVRIIIVQIQRGFQRFQVMSRYQLGRHLRIASICNARGSASSSNPAISKKPRGDISSIFPSLSGAQNAPLPPRFADVKSRLINGHEDAIRESWVRLLSDLQKETETIRAAGSSIIPELAFSDLDNVEKRAKFKDQLHKLGVAVIKGVVSEKEALE